MKKLNGKTGLFFIIDGNIYQSITDEEVHLNSHVQFFEIILKENPDLLTKYRNYSYLYFPRGIIVKDNHSDQLIIGRPAEFSDIKTIKILKSFGFSEDVEYIIEKDEDHYNLDWILDQVAKHKEWGDIILIDEIKFVKEFFISQIEKF